MEAVQTFPFVPLFPSLLCSSLLFISSLDLRPVQMVSAWVFTTCQWRWSFPVRWIGRKVAIELYRLVVGLMGSYDCVRRAVVCLLPFIPFPSFLLYWRWQPRRSAPKEGDNVTATRDLRQGKCQCIYITVTALRSVSNILPLYSTYILTRSRVQRYYHIIRLRSSVGVHASTWILQHIVYYLPPNKTEFILMQ